MKLRRHTIAVLLVLGALTGCARLLQIGQEPPLTPPGQLESGGVVPAARADIRMPLAQHEPLRVVNIDSRVTVVGTVTGPGMVRVGSASGASGAVP